MINDETQDQDLQEEQKAMPADAKVLLDKVHMTVPAPPPGDEWVAEAVKAVEASITKLIDEFRAQPFIHRVEHSLHVRLMQLLSEREHLRGWYPIDGSGFKTQLIHKEWPETRPRKKKPELIVDRRRGSFDVVVLAPSQLEKATLEQLPLVVSTLQSPSSWVSATGTTTSAATGRSSRTAGSSTRTLSISHGCRRVIRK
jgi:hypothetical protein